MSAGNVHNVPRRMRERYESVTEITDEFCQQHLNEEYADLSLRMAAALSRKRPSPLESGRARSWAAGIVYALGRVNFLSDSSREPHMTMSELCEKIGVSQSTASNKSREIWDRLDLLPLHADWCLPSMLEENPLVWIVEVNGLPVDVRAMPREDTVLPGDSVANVSQIITLDKKFLRSG
jgi:DNA-binding transcriptional ArsR family regulator